MTPMPPACAIAIASRASVTVSIAEERIGRLSRIARVRRVADVDRARHHRGMARPQQDVVERQPLDYAEVFALRHEIPRKTFLRRRGA